MSATLNSLNMHIKKNPLAWKMLRSDSAGEVNNILSE